jgi:hypothetical protein
MKTVLVAIITVFFIGVTGYSLMRKETTPLKSENTQLKARLQVVEAFIKAEEDFRQKTSLKPDTRMPDVVKTVNRLAVEQKHIEDSIQLGFKDIDGRLADVKATNEEGRKKLSQKIDDLSKKADLYAKENEFQSFAENAKARVLKIKIELLAKKIGIAKGELDLLSQTLEDAKKLVGDNGNKKTAIERLQVMVKEIRAEIDTNLPAATDRIDLLWHGLGKLSNDG